MVGKIALLNKMGKEFSPTLYVERYEQAISFVSGFGLSSVYYISFDDRDLKCKRYKVDQAAAAKK